MSKKAMRLALEALENAQANFGNWWPEAIVSLREALASEAKEQPAQQEQEPVAWMFEFPDKRVKPKFDSAPHGGNWQPLYTHPQPDAYGYAKRLAEAIWKKHYQSTAPQWEPFDDLMGVLTQIDNMTAGLTTPPAAQPAPVQQEPVYFVWLRAHCAWMHTDEESFEKISDDDRWMLYTSPPQRKPLTDEQIWKFWWGRPEVPEGEDDSMEAQFVAAVRAIESAHGIKVNT